MKLINIVQLIVAIALAVSILLQSKGSGLSGAFGGGGGGGYYTKRGVEKFLFYTSIVLSVCFIVLAIVNIVVVNS